MQRGDQLRLLPHLPPASDESADHAADPAGDEDQGEFLGDRQGDRHCDPHADHAEVIAAARRDGRRKPFQREDEQDARREVPERELVGGHFPSPFAPSRLAGFFLYISSMRCVTRKPPTTLTAASPTATAPSTEPASTSYGPA